MVAYVLFFGHVRPLGRNQFLKRRCLRRSFSGVLQGVRPTLSRSFSFGMRQGKGAVAGEAVQVS